MLVLIVAVFIILGGLYQLNGAFKAWANNYFGDYLACILETGELPTVQGSPGDSGLCDQLFKTFSLAEGRPHKNPIVATGGGTEAKGNDERNQKRGGGGGRGGGGSGGMRYGGEGGRFRASKGSGGKTNSSRKLSATNTGNTGASDYGGGYSYYQRPQRHKMKSQLDNKFAFDDGRGRQQRRAMASTAKSKEDEGREKQSFKMKKNALKTKSTATADTEFSIGNFIKYIIIICIILALLFFLGGQALSITKSME